MQQVFAVYKTDNWHSYRSRDLIGIATTKTNALKLCKQQARKEGNRINKDTFQFLSEKNQTQDYEGDGEFVIDPVEKNKLI